MADAGWEAYLSEIRQANVRIGQLEKALQEVIRLSEMNDGLNYNFINTSIREVATWALAPQGSDEGEADA